MSEPPPALRLRTTGFKVDTDDLSTPPPPPWHFSVVLLLATWLPLAA